MNNKKWIQKALKKHKAGSLHQQLGVPKGEVIPKSMLAVIKRKEIGQFAKNPTKRGKRRVKVTRLLKKRAVLAHTIRGFK